MAFSVSFLRAALRVSPLKEAIKVKCPVHLELTSYRLIWTECPKFGKSQEDRIWVDELPKPGTGKAYRRIIHYPEQYTVKPLEVTNLAGRDPVTGRVICNGIGGGIKHKYHWIQWKRVGPKEGKPIEERVIQIIDDGCRTAKVALVAGGDELKYYLATDNMKAGDIVKTSGCIPRIPVRPNEGDAYPLGALPMGTQVHCVEQFPGQGSRYIHAAGTYATLVRRVGDHIIVQLPSKHQLSLSQECMAVVGRLSNIMHSKTPIGSPNRLRELGYRPRSGLWQRKTGRLGRKIRPLPPIRVMNKPLEPRWSPITLTLKTEYYTRKQRLQFL